MGKVEGNALIDEDGVSEEDEAIADVDGKLAIEASKERLLRSYGVGDDREGSVTPIQDNPRSSPKLPEDEKIELPQVSMGSTPKVSSPLVPPGLKSISQGSVPRSSSWLGATNIGMAPGSGFSSMIIESPSFTAPVTSEKTSEPIVMAETVLESTSRQQPGQPTRQEIAPPKVSRFKASRS